MPLRSGTGHLHTLDDADDDDGNYEPQAASFTLAFGYLVILVLFISCLEICLSHWKNELPGTNYHHNTELASECARYSREKYRHA